MVLKGINCVHKDNIRSNGLEKNQIIWSWKESYVYIMIKLGHMVLQGLNWVHNAKIMANGLEMNQLGTICKTKNNI